MGTHTPLHTDDIVRPKTRKRGICFLHLPKTAGSFVGACFEKQYGTENCALFIEKHLTNSIQNGVDAPVVADFVSAHASFNTLSVAGVRNNFDVFTILRDPIDRIVSHMNWMDRFHHKDRRHDIKKLPKARRSVLAQLKDADCHDLRSMRRFFYLDDLAKAHFFLNMQTALIMDCVRRDILSIVSLSHVPEDVIRERLRKFRFIGLIGEFKDHFSAQTGLRPADLDGEVNKTEAKRFLRTPELERCCRPYVDADERLMEICASERKKGNLNSLVID